MWRKLLILCAFSAISCTQAAAIGIDGSLAEPATAAASASPAQRRIALVIGNGSYDDSPLVNALNDAQAIGSLLQRLGFEVIRADNASRQQMQDALGRFQRRLDAGGVGLFYFAGHGVRAADRTVLVPVDIGSGSPSRLLTHGIDLQSVLQSMSAPRPGKRNLVILDACLNNPFSARASADTGPDASADTGPDLSTDINTDDDGDDDDPDTDLPEQTLLAFATAPGGFAADGRRHGLYTAALLEALAVPGRSVEQALRQAASAVGDASGQRQKPWLASSLSGRLHLVAPAPDVPVPAPTLRPAEAVLALHSRGLLPKDSAEQVELTFWESIKDSSHASDYEAYLQAYPNGRFATLARSRIERLKAATPKAETPAKEALPPAPKAAPKAPPKAAPERARPAPAAKPAAAPAATAPAKAPAAAAGAAVRDCPACPELITLAAGGLTMGSNSSDPSEKPAHAVTLATPFAIGKYEVTVEQWNACASAGACPHIPTNDSAPKNTPARDISWDDAAQYLKWLGKTSGKSYRLPTEAEWEYAARGGTASRYWWGDQMRSGNANCKECGEPWHQEGPAPVGSFAANPYGLYDMNGSVWEWVSDCWHTSYKGAPADGSSWDEPNCRARVIRGGSWREGASYMPSTTRFKYDASVRHSQNGFRVARDAQ